MVKTKIKKQKSPANDDWALIYKLILQFTKRLNGINKRRPMLSFDIIYSRRTYMIHFRNGLYRNQRTTQ